MFLCEHYKSIQGEGLLTGTESVFVRSSGCNLRCDFCDTPFSSWNPEGHHTSIDEIVQLCQQLDCQHVVLTGGEPMIQPDVVELTNRLSEKEFHITIETAGTVDKPVSCDLMSISPKLSNSTPSVERAGEWSAKHDRDRHQPEVIHGLLNRYPYQLKFVADHPEDGKEIIRYLKEFPEVAVERVLIMPQGIDVETLQAKEGWVRAFCDDNGFQYCPRMHIHWFGNQRGT